jgi:hypothetical protein
MSNILRDMRKAKRTKELNPSRYVPHVGIILSHVAQGVLKNSRKVRQDHVIWKANEDREHTGHDDRTPTLQFGGQFSGYGA